MSTDSPSLKLSLMMSTKRQKIWKVGLPSQDIGKGDPQDQIQPKVTIV